MDVLCDPDIVYWENLDMVKILSNNADIKILNQQLLLAINNNNLLIAEYLIQCGAYIDVEYAFYYIALGGNLELIKMCIGLHTYTNTMYKWILTIIAGGAAKSGHKYIIEYVFELYKEYEYDEKLIYVVYGSSLAGAIVNNHLNIVVWLTEHSQRPKELDKKLNFILKHVNPRYKMLKYILNNYKIRDSVIIKMLNRTTKNSIKRLLNTHLNKQ